MNLTIRKAEVKDAQAILNLIIELANFEKKPDAVKINLNDVIENGFGKNAKFNSIVALENEQIIGALVYYERYSTWKGKFLHLEDLIIHSSKRGSGVGKHLLAHFLKFAFNNGYNEITGEVTCKNVYALEFYKSLGGKELSEWKMVSLEKNNIKETFYANAHNI